MYLYQGLLLVLSIHETKYVDRLVRNVELFISRELKTDKFRKEFNQSLRIGDKIPLFPTSM
jgi:hypothetical protein